MKQLIWPFSMAVILACALAVGCAKSANNAGVKTGGAAPVPATADTAAVLRAEPNPVPLGTGKGPASTTLTWSAPDDSFNQVYVSVDGGPEKMVVQGASGTETIDWIYPNAAYEFRLYAGKEHQQVLATVQVKRQ